MNDEQYNLVYARFKQLNKNLDAEKMADIFKSIPVNAQLWALLREGRTGREVARCMHNTVKRRLWDKAKRQIQEGKDDED